jgi:hypothetical protein
VGEQPGTDLERAGREPVARVEGVQRERLVEHSRPVEGVNAVGRYLPEQPGEYRVSGIDQHPEAIVFHQVSAARTARRGPSAASAQYRHSHRLSPFVALAA